MSEGLDDDLRDRLADVVQLFPDDGDDDAPVTRTEEAFCAHRLIRIDKSAHRTFCRECGREVDPFDFLLRLAGEWDRWQRAEKEAKRRAFEAQARLEDVLRLEKNARARVKRLDPKGKLPPVPWGEGSSTL